MCDTGGVCLYLECAWCLLSMALHYTSKDDDVTEAAERSDRELVMAGRMPKATPVFDGHFFGSFHNISDVELWKYLQHK